MAYVPQIANVHNMSVRDNILYGTRMNRANYERVLRSCQLRNDLIKFPAGDLTEVGEKVSCANTLTKTIASFFF